MKGSWRLGRCWIVTATIGSTAAVKQVGLARVTTPPPTLGGCQHLARLCGKKWWLGAIKVGGGVCGQAPRKGMLASTGSAVPRPVFLSTAFRGCRSGPEGRASKGVRLKHKPFGVCQSRGRYGRAEDLILFSSATTAATCDCCAAGSARRPRRGVVTTEVRGRDRRSHQPAGDHRAAYLFLGGGGGVSRKRFLSGRSHSTRTESADEHGTNSPAHPFPCP